MYPYAAAVVLGFVVLDHGICDRDSLSGRINIDAAARVAAAFVSRDIAFLDRHSRMGIDPRPVASGFVIAYGDILEADFCGFVCTEKPAACIGTVTRDAAARHDQTASGDDAAAAASCLVSCDGAALNGAARSFLDVDAAAVIGPSSGDHTAAGTVDDGQISFIAYPEDMPVRIRFGPSSVQFLAVQVDGHGLSADVEVVLAVCVDIIPKLNRLVFVRAVIDRILQRLPV